MRSFVGSRRLGAAVSCYYQQQYNKFYRSVFNFVPGCCLKSLKYILKDVFGQEANQICREGEYEEYPLKSAGRLPILEELAHMMLSIHFLGRTKDNSLVQSRFYAGFKIGLNSMLALTQGHF